MGKVSLFERYDLNLMTQQLEKRYSMKYDYKHINRQEVSFMPEDRILNQQMDLFKTEANEEVSISMTLNDSKWSGTQHSRRAVGEDSFEIQVQQQEK